jgi:hypothetical protein
MIIMGMYSIPVIKWRPTLDIPWKHPHKLAITNYNINFNHYIQLHKINILAQKVRYMDHVSWMPHSNKFVEKELSMSKLYKPCTCSLMERWRLFTQQCNKLFEIWHSEQFEV